MWSVVFSPLLAGDTRFPLFPVQCGRQWNQYLLGKLESLTRIVRDDFLSTLRLARTEWEWRDQITAEKGVDYAPSSTEPGETRASRLIIVARFTIGISRNVSSVYSSAVLSSPF